MAFTSWTFAVFVLAAAAVYYLVPKAAQWMVLLAASFGFYLAGGRNTIWYLLFTIFTTYAAGLLLGRMNQRRAALAKGAEQDSLRRKKKLVVFLAVLANFGMLVLTKYGGLLASRLGPALGGGLLTVEPVLPLGLSFFIFQSIGYVVDCCRGKYPPERSLAKFALFVSFFPQMVQGPISRFDSLGPQLTARRSFDADKVKYGIQLVMWGYFKKLVISDRAGVIADTVFGGYTQYHGTLLAAGVFFYCIQLYCDFSGGIDIARGVAQVFGIELAENFRRPLFATSLADYWRRWHITLGQWMRDYVFFPLSLSRPFVRLGRWSRRHIGGKTGKIVATSAATFIVYFLIGLWHGTSLRYVAFGLWNGCVITLSLLLEGRFQQLREKFGIRTQGLPWRVFQMCRTALLVFFGRYLTRAPRLLAALWMLWWTVADPEPAALWDGRMLALGLGLGDIMVILLGMAVVLAVELYQERGGHVRSWLEQRHWLVQWGAIMAPLLAILLLGIMRGGYIPPAFIYQQF